MATTKIVGAKPEISVGAHYGSSLILERSRLSHADTHPGCTTPVLSRKAARVQASDLPQVRAALPGMFAAMYRAPGIGLAAPQVGIGLRFVIIDISENDARRPRIIINPEITSFSDEEAVTEEGCLSVPTNMRRSSDRRASR